MIQKIVTFGTLAVASSLLSAQITLEQWTFDTDTAGTILANAANSGDLGTSTWGEFNAVTNGSGQLVIGDTTVDQGYWNANIQFGAGILTYEVVLSSWDLDDVEIANNNFRNFGITLRDSTAAVNLLDMQLNNRTTDRLRLRFTTSDGDYANAVATGWAETDLLPAVQSANALTMRLTLDTTTGDYAGFAEIGASQQSWTGVFDGDMSGIDVIRMYAGNGDWANPTTGGDNGITDFIAVDSISFTAPVPEPATFALLAGIGALGFMFFQRRRK